MATSKNRIISTALVTLSFVSLLAATSASAGWRWHSHAEESRLPNEQESAEIIKALKMISKSDHGDTTIRADLIDLFAQNKILIVTKWSRGDEGSCSEYSGGKIYLSGQFFEHPELFSLRHKTPSAKTVAQFNELSAKQTLVNRFMIAQSLTHEWTHSKQNYAQRTRFFIVNSELEALLSEDSLSGNLRSFYRQGPMREALEETNTGIQDRINEVQTTKSE